jgi:hypothetical protein
MIYDWALAHRLTGKDRQRWRFRFEKHRRLVGAMGQNELIAALLFGH